MAAPKRVLVVDDHPEVLQMVTGYLKERGYLVTGAPDGERALRTLIQTRPDLVLLDYQMPGLDGLSLTTLIRQHDPSIKIIVLTGSDRPDVAARVIRSGVVAFVPKPVGLEHLEHLVAIAIGEGRPGVGHAGPPSPR